MGSGIGGQRVVTSKLGRLPSELDPLISSGIELFNAGSTQAAFEILDRAVEQDPLSVGARLFRAVALLREARGVTRADTVDPGSILVEGVDLRPVDLVDSLEAGGVTVIELRGTTFEDSYLALFEDQPRSSGETPGAVSELP